ncbi:LytR/AlgR family response regulator transcription factor, partial [Bacteroides intestinalis]|uniref:LytR/AlgR family response regulator transcription factor n=1 Tax=Bacteroides intestinalis TaxID=329854 RepID=UPI000E4DC0A7
MNCIIIDDEPLAREAMEMLVQENKELCLLGMFNNAVSATQFMEEHSVDLIFLDIQMRLCQNSGTTFFMHKAQTFA